MDTCCNKPIIVCSNDCDEQSQTWKKKIKWHRNVHINMLKRAHGSASLVPIPSPGARKAAKQFVFKEILHPWRADKPGKTLSPCPIHKSSTKHWLIKRTLAELTSGQDYIVSMEKPKQSRDNFISSFYPCVPNTYVHVPQEADPQMSNCLTDSKKSFS